MAWKWADSFTLPPVEFVLATSGIDFQPIHDTTREQVTKLIDTPPQYCAGIRRPFGAAKDLRGRTCRHLLVLTRSIDRGIEHRDSYNECLLHHDG